MGSSVVVIVFIMCVSFAYSLNDEQTIVDRCKSGAQLPNVTIITGDKLCIKPPCIVHPGSSAALTLDFISTGYVPTITPKFVATAAGATIPYPANQKDACVGITNTVCPLVENEPVSYTYKIQLASWFPNVAVILEISLINDDDQQVITCFSVTLQVESQ